MKILLAYDGFEHSRHALEETAKLTAEGKGEITVLSVVPPDARGSKSGGHVMLRPHAHEDVARAHAYLRELGLPSEMKLEAGDPAEKIVAEATTGGYDVVVVGSAWTRGVGPTVSRQRQHRGRRPRPLPSPRRRRGHHGADRADPAVKPLEAAATREAASALRRDGRDGRRPGGHEERRHDRPRLPRPQHSASAILGSVSQGVLRHASRPVLVGQGRQGDRRRLSSREDRARAGHRRPSPVSATDSCPTSWLAPFARNRQTRCLPDRHGPCPSLRRS